MPSDVRACCPMLFQAGPLLVQRLFSTVEKLNATIDTINEELPGVAASIRLTSLEMADCILEFAGLGRDVSGGLQAGGRALKATEASLQESGAALKSVWANYVKPGINRRIKASKGSDLYSLVVTQSVHTWHRLKAKSAACRNIGLYSRS